MKSKTVLVSVLVTGFLAVAAGSFWLGTYYERQTAVNRMRQFAGGAQQGQPPGMSDGNQQDMPGGQPDGEMGISGKVDKIDNNTITITARMGSQKIEISSDLKVNKSASGSIDDIKKGAEIFVQGERDDDGTIKAETIQIISIGD